MRTSRYTNEWYPLVLYMCKRYPQLKNEDTLQSCIFTEAVEKTLSELSVEKDFGDRMRAFNMMYFEGNKTIDATAMALYTSRRTVQRWINDFVNRVGKNAGF